MSGSHRIGPSGAGGLPSLTNGDIWVGNASNVATAVAPSGDVTITNAGVTSIKSSVALAGNPTTTTQSQGDNSTKIATTAYADTGLATKEPAKTLNGINTQTASYVLVIGDAGLLVEMNVGSANTLTIPPNSSVAFAIDTRIDIVQYGAGQTTVTPGSGVTIRAAASALKMRVQYSGATLYQRATDEWVLVGDTTA